MLEKPCPGQYEPVEKDYVKNFHGSADDKKTQQELPKGIIILKSVRRAADH